MKTLIKNDYLEVTYYENESILEYAWSEGSQDISDEEFKTKMLTIQEFSKQYTPKGFMANNRDRTYVVNLEMQKWIKKNIWPYHTEYGTTKFALVMPTELIPALSSEQTIGDAIEESPVPMDIQYFEDRGAALRWLVDYSPND